MLVCPHCQSNNSNNQQSCHRCGTSLTHKTCPECGYQVSLNALKCPYCQTFTGSVWLAIVAEPLHSVTEQTLLNITQSQDPLVDNYLDSGQRYQLIRTNENDLAQTSVIDSTTHRYLQRSIIDCQPQKKSVLSILLEQHNDDTIQDVKNYTWLPKLALPYIILQVFCPAIPEIHDAWQDDDREVVILSDRSGWQLLTELWSEQSLPILQIVYWFDEMAKLWTSLIEIGYGQSLLVETNLRVDEDQTFGLEKLYSDPVDRQLTLKDLAQSWQKLIAHFDPPSESLITFLDKVFRGEIDTVTELRRQLQKIGDEQQLHSLSYAVNLNEAEESKMSIVKVTQTGYDPTKDGKNLVHSLAAESIESARTSQTSDFNAEIALHQDLTTSLDEPLLADQSDELSTVVVPMQMFSLSDAGYSDKGRQRRHNEDCFRIDSQVKKQQTNQGQRVQARGLYIICDGMGGHSAGEVASAMAVETLQGYFCEHWQDEFPSLEMLQKGIFQANQTIYQVNQEKASHGSGRMGTTLVMALLQNTRLAIAHVGDSRVYRITRKWGLEQLSVDHEVGQRAIQEGIEPKIAYARPDAYQLTQAIGPYDDCYLEPDVQFLDILEDSLFLLCSDGLSDYQFVENHWQTHLSPLLSSVANLEEGLHQLIALANQKNGHDNITAILIRVKVQPNVEQSIWI